MLDLTKKKVLVAQLCLILCDPMDCSSPGSSAHGILQTRVLEWVAITFSGDLPDKGWNPALLHCRQILYHLRHQGNPRFLIKNGPWHSYPYHYRQNSLERHKLKSDCTACVCVCVCVCLRTHTCRCTLSRSVASCALVFAAPWTVDCQAPRSMEFSRQQYWSGLSCPTPGDHSNPGIKPVSFASPVLAGGSLPLALLGKPYCIFTMQMINEKNYYEQE